MAGVLKPSPGALRIIDDLEEGLAIVVNGNTAPKNIAAGQYLFIKNHSTLATGGYHATAAISSGGTISSSNVAADADGIANSLNSNKQNKLKTKYYNMPTASDNVSFSSLDIPKGSFVSALVINTNYVIAVPYTYSGENNQYLGFINLNDMGTRATGQYNIKITYYD